MSHTLILADIATVVGYLAVSRPFLTLSNPRFLESTHDARMMVSASLWYRVMCVGGGVHRVISCCGLPDGLHVFQFTGEGCAVC